MLSILWNGDVSYATKMHLWGRSNDSEAIMMTLKPHIINLIWSRVNECRTPTELIRTLEKGLFRVNLLIDIILIIQKSYYEVSCYHQFMSVEHKNWTTLVFAHQWWLHLCSKQPSTRFTRLFYNLNFVWMFLSVLSTTSLIVFKKKTSDSGLLWTEQTSSRLSPTSVLITFYKYWFFCLAVLFLLIYNWFSPPPVLIEPLEGVPLLGGPE